MFKTYSNLIHQKIMKIKSLQIKSRKTHMKKKFWLNRFRKTTSIRSLWNKMAQRKNKLSINPNKKMKQRATMHKS